MTTEPIAPTQQATLLIVDDEPANLVVLNQILQPFYRMRAARNGEQALRAAATAPRPDLILLDIMMPEMDGYTVLAELRKIEACRNTPVIFITALSDEASEVHGLELGAADYISKPITPNIVLARVRLHLELKAARDALANQNALLEERVAERTAALKKAVASVESANAALKKTYFSTLLAISAITELRGGNIGEHSRRVAEFSRQLARRLGMSDAEAQDVFVAALLHDIGMVGFPDDLLAKPVSSMTQEQLIQYHSHPSIGAMALHKIESLAAVADIINDHHEHIDGRGFPSGKSGLSIPLGARIIAVASDYDDLRHGKLTGKPLPAKLGFEYLLEGRGTRYDPRVVDAFEELIYKDIESVIIEIPVSPAHLHEGMVLTRNAMHPDGFLLLSKDAPITRTVIDQLVNIDKELGGKLRLYVKRESSSFASSASAGGAPRTRPVL